LTPRTTLFPYRTLFQSYGETYDRSAFAPREFKGHHLSVMFDILDKGASTTGEKGELGRSVDLDTLDDGYRLALEITRVDTAEEVDRKSTRLNSSHGSIS